MVLAAVGTLIVSLAGFLRAHGCSESPVWKPLTGVPESVRGLKLMPVRKAPRTRAGITATRDETDLDRAATLQLVIALARAVKEIDKWVRPHLARQGLGGTEFAVLEVLYHKGPL